MTWHHAQMHCKRMVEGLVKFTSARENEFVLALAREREHQQGNKCGSA